MKRWSSDKSTSLMEEFTEDEIAQAIVSVLDLEPKAEKTAKTSSRRAVAGSIRDLPDRPKELIAIGDRIEVIPGDGAPVKGVVDRISTHHIQVRPHPQVIRGKVKTHSVDWRQRKTWKKFLVTKKGSTDTEMYRGKSGMTSSAILSIDDADLPRIRRFSARTEAITTPVIAYRPATVMMPRSKVAAREKPAYSDAEIDASNREDLDNLESMLSDEVFATGHLSDRDAWETAWETIHRAFTGLDTRDKDLLKRKFRRMRKKVASPVGNSSL